MALATRVDFVGDTIIYKGSGAPGSLDGQPAWRVSKIEFIGPEKDVMITWASGNENLDKIWNDRLTYTYT